MSWQRSAAQTLAAVIAAYGLAACSGPQGPLTAGVPESIYGPSPIGKEETFGNIILTLSGHETAVIERVTWRESHAGSLDTLGVLAVGPERSITYGSVYGFPPPGMKGIAKRTTDFKVLGTPSDRPSRGVELLFGFVPRRRDVYTISHFEVRYHVGSDHYTLRVPQTFVMCAGMKACPSDVR